MISIKKHIPNTITSINLACGTVGVVAAFSGQPELAFILMIAGAVADFFDGFTARLVGAYSPMGKELDSLADMVTFGLLPSVMLFKMMGGSLDGGNVVAWVPLLIAVFSGLRLAKFNIDERQTSSFLGLPTPACAMICGSLAVTVAKLGPCMFADLAVNSWAVPVLSLILSGLLVSEIPMFSMKLHKGDPIGWQRIAFGVTALAGAVATPVLGLPWPCVLLIPFSAYILINLLNLKR